jgi:hypothetical protein
LRKERFGLHVIKRCSEGYVASQRR